MSILSARSNRPPASTVNPHPKNLLPPVSAGWPGAHAVSGERVLPADGLGNIAEALRVYLSTKASECASREELGTVPSSQAQTLHGRLLRGAPIAAVETQTYNHIKDPDVEAKRPRRPRHRLSVPDTASSIESRARHKPQNPQSGASRCRVRLPPSSHDGHLARVRQAPGLRGKRARAPPRISKISARSKRSPPASRRRGRRVPRKRARSRLRAA